MKNERLIEQANNKDIKDKKPLTTSKASLGGKLTKQLRKVPGQIVREFGSSKDTSVYCTVYSRVGKSRSEYHVEPKTSVKIPGGFNPVAIIDFQDGSIIEAGVNGCQPEDLVEIVIDYLAEIQKTGDACRENTQAITKLEESILWLRNRS